MDNTRREFIKKSCLTAIAIGFGGSALISSCSDSNVNPFTKMLIDQDNCIGCGECLESCFYEAIALPEKSEYSIDTRFCIECGKCKEFCTYDAIIVSTIDYIFHEDKCVGCGECISECENEGNCISYEKEDYTVRNKCKLDRCHLQCLAVCPEEAITIGNHAIIDLDKCTKCGECVAVCPFEAINPAKVVKNDADCNHCGKCFQICDWEAIERIEPDNYESPHIIKDKCTSCGDCKDACPDYDAINIQIHTAKINDRHCRDCGKCLDYCRFDSIARV
jgi:ferredoxin